MLVLSFALCPDNEKHHPVMYVAEFGVIFLVKSSRTASKRQGLDCLGLNRSGLEVERHFRLVIEPT